MLSLWKGEIREKLRPMREVLDEVAARHGVTVEEMRGDSRRQYIAWARQEAYALLWHPRVASRSAPIVARFLNRKDHTTVISGARAHLRRTAERMAAE